MTFNYGEPISVELSEYLKDFTDTQSIADVSTKTGISISTLKYLKLRTNSVTENNIHRATQCKKDLSEILDEHES